MSACIVACEHFPIAVCFCRQSSTTTLAAATTFGRTALLNLRAHSSGLLGSRIGFFHDRPRRGGRHVAGNSARRFCFLILAARALMRFGSASYAAAAA